MTWIRTANSIGIVARVRRAENTAAKSLAATAVADQVAPLLVAAVGLAGDAGVVEADQANSSPSSRHPLPVDYPAGWQVRAGRVPPGRWLRGRHCGQGWAHQGRAVRQSQADFPVVPTCSSSVPNSAGATKTISSRCADCWQSMAVRVRWLTTRLWKRSVEHWLKRRVLCHRRASWSTRSKRRRVLTPAKLAMPCEPTIVVHDRGRRGRRPQPRRNQRCPRNQRFPRRPELGRLRR